MKPLVIALGIAMSLLGCTSSTNWTDLGSMDELKDAFNRDHGRVRVVLILSPT